MAADEGGSSATACTDCSSSLLVCWSSRAVSCHSHHCRLAQQRTPEITLHTRTRIAMPSSMVMTAGLSETVRRSVNRRTQGCGLRRRAGLGAPNTLNQACFTSLNGTTERPTHEGGGGSTLATYCLTTADALAIPNVNGKRPAMADRAAADMTESGAVVNGKASPPLGGWHCYQSGLSASDVALNRRSADRRTRPQACRGAFQA